MGNKALISTMYEGVVESESSAVKLRAVASDVRHPLPTIPLNFPLNYESPPAFFENQQQLPPPHSWTQQTLLMGGIGSEDDKLGLSLIQEKNLHNLGQQLLGFSTNSKQDPSSQLSANCNYSTDGVAKKAKIQHSSTKTTTIKVRKEKLGDRITALHQLVSPFGKTDTATVLLEAIGYIKFLEKQIEALSVPYMGRGSGKTMRQEHLLSKGKCMKRKGIYDDLESGCDEEPKKDLRSRGLCLVPMMCTLDVGSENGDDYNWATN